MVPVVFAAPGTPRRLYIAEEDWQDVQEFRLSLQEKPRYYPKSDGEEDDHSSDVRRIINTRAVYEDNRMS